MNPELFGYLAALLTASSFVPQAVKTIRTRDTHSLSLSMYTMFVTGVICWLLYGFHKQDDVIILANTLTLIFASPILAIKLQNTLRSAR